MSVENYWPKPPGLEGCIDSDESVTWFLRLAIACMKDGSAATLATRLGVTPNTLYLAVHRNSCTDDLAKRIEKFFGREFFPRELFTPEPSLPVE